MAPPDPCHDAAASANPGLGLTNSLYSSTPRHSLRTLCALSAHILQRAWNDLDFSVLWLYGLWCCNFGLVAGQFDVWYKASPNHHKQLKAKFGPTQKNPCERAKLEGFALSLLPRSRAACRLSRACPSQPKLRLL